MVPTAALFVGGLILLAAAVSAGAAEGQCPVKLGPPGECLRGRVLDRLTSVTTPEACCAACAARTPQCAAFEVRAWGRGGTEWTCILQNTTGPAIEGNCSGSGSFAQGPPPAPSPPQPPGPPPPLPPAPTGVAFASMFSGGAVLQKEARVAVWGTSSSGAGSAVQLSLGVAHVASAIVAANGTWRAHLPPQQVSWAVTLTASDGHSTTRVTVKFGQVLMCSGQSNMGMPVYHVPPGFSAFDGLAEVDAAARYTGKISLLSLQPARGAPGSQLLWNGTDCGMDPAPGCVAEPEWNDVVPGENGTVAGFSAPCWYTGKAMFDRLSGRSPIGLIRAAVGGSPIEFWLPEGSVNTTAACGLDVPACDTEHNHTDSGFYDRLVRPLAPYTLGAMLWDQGERDVHCLTTYINHTARYPCLERELIRSWRESFDSNFVFVAIQLPGYIGDCDGNGKSTGKEWCIPGVFNMRLAQDEGVEGDTIGADSTPTYDLSCPFGVKTPECPFGSVHNVKKREIGDRAARQLLHLLGETTASTAAVVNGPRATGASAAPAGGGGGGNSTVVVSFAGGGALYTNGTQYCITCCDGGVGDFDASDDGGLTWVNGTVPVVVGGMSVRFSVATARTPTHVRYTANMGFPQCAVYNAEGLPAYPFAMAVVVGQS